MYGTGTATPVAGTYSFGNYYDVHSFALNQSAWDALTNASGAGGSDNFTFGSTLTANSNDDAYLFSGGTFATLDVQVSDTAPVPEPSTWAMGILMLVGLGLVARRRAGRDNAAGSPGGVGSVQSMKATQRRGWVALWCVATDRYEPDSPHPTSPGGGGVRPVGELCSSM